MGDTGEPDDSPASVEAQLDRDDKLGSLGLDMTHSKMGTSKVLQSDKGPQRKRTSKYKWNNLHSLSSLGTSSVL